MSESNETKNAAKNAFSEGVVIRVDAQYPLIECGQRRFRCMVRKRLKYKLKGNVKRVCVGDRVMLTVPDNDENLGAIEEVMPRKTQLTRTAAGREGYHQTVAANVDQLIIVVATHNPELHSRLIDRIAIGGEQGELACVIVVNKIDLAERDAIAKRLHYYPEIGYPVLMTSATEGTGLEELKEVLRDKSSVFAGPSGAGKSSLLNAVQPGMRLTTGEVSQHTGKGKHTTTFVQLLKLDFGGYVVDTPGIREFGLWNVERLNLAEFFPEMVKYIGQCHYKDCAHISEPGCEIKAAVERGEISPERYASFALIYETIDEKQHWE